MKNDSIWPKRPVEPLNTGHECDPRRDLQILQKSEHQVIHHGHSDSSSKGCHLSTTTNWDQVSTERIPYNYNGIERGPTHHRSIPSGTPGHSPKDDVGDTGGTPMGNPQRQSPPTKESFQLS